MNPPQVYMCSPSWTLHPPPSPFHPSGSSQCTSPKHPVSCIEPGLATHFIHDIFYSSAILFSFLLIHYILIFKKIYVSLLGLSWFHLHWKIQTWQRFLHACFPLPWLTVYLAPDWVVPWLSNKEILCASAFTYMKVQRDLFLEVSEKYIPHLFQNRFPIN